MIIWLHHYLYGLCVMDGDPWVFDYTSGPYPNRVCRFRTLSGISFQARLSSITLDIQE